MYFVFFQTKKKEEKEYARSRKRKEGDIFRSILSHLIAADMCKIEFCTFLLNAKRPHLSFGPVVGRLSLDRVMWSLVECLIKANWLIDSIRINK